MNPNPNRLLQALEERFLLLVSIPRNDLTLARAAAEAGADAIKVHLNCQHFASGTCFGSWPEEKAVIAEIRKNLEIPLGIVTGAEELPSDEDLPEIRRAGFDFWDLFAHHTPPGYLDWPEMAHMVAVDPTWTPEFVQDLVALGVQVIESSIIPRPQYRTRLTAADLTRYAVLVRSARIPVVVPTQKAVRPDEIQYLHRVGVRGLVIGAVVTGHEVEGLRAAVGAFRQAIDALPRPAR